MALVKRAENYFMIGKSIDYWRQAWDSVAERSYPGDVADHNVGKTLGLLAQYSRFFKGMVAWGGSIGRFFSGQWNTHHGDAVQNAIGNFYHMDGMYAYISAFHAVEFVLAVVKREVGNNPINPNGDLARILQVVNERTGVDYYTLDANEIITRHIEAANVHLQPPIDPAHHHIY
jgi:hypothetical protein